MQYMKHIHTYFFRGGGVHPGTFFGTNSVTYGKKKYTSCVRTNRRRTREHSSEQHSTVEFRL